MSQFFTVPEIYEDMSNQSQGYFAFRFRCNLCGWNIESMPIRSSVSTITNIADVGIGFLGGFWGRAAQEGEQMFGSKWHQEQANALQKAWAQVQQHFHYCPKCRRTVCMRCFNLKLNLCSGCAPDLKSDAASYQHEMNVEAQRQQIEQNYRAPQFNTDVVPSAVTPEMMRPPRGGSSPQLPPAQSQNLPQSPAPGQLQAPSPASIAGFSTPGYPQQVVCPTCRRMGPPGKFCQDCGTKLPLPDLFCPQCATPIENGAHFCPDCGAKLQAAT
ncbi:MAG: zinc ribbon domain-containing protein [Ktedonobacteraceae bacterium]